MIFFASQKKESTSYRLQAISFSSGFTFIETLVAIAILLLAVVAPLSLVYQSLAASRVARNQVTAIYLAQESIEFIRATRDTNALSGNDWLEGLGDCIAEDGCYIDIPDAGVQPCEGECPMVQYNSTNYLYGHGDGTKLVEDSVFRRTIIIEESTPGLEVHVETRVEWLEGTAERNVTLDEYIYNWQ